MSTAESLKQVVERHLCMGCGTCAASHPDLVRMVDTENLGRRPHFSSAATADALRDLTAVCPGRLIPAKQIVNEGVDEYEYLAWGPILEVWEGFATHTDVRHRGSSGGVVTALSAFCLEHLNFSGAIHVRARQDAPILNESIIATTPQEVTTAAASRYAPASPCERLADLRERTGAHVFVGKPCDIAGAASLAQRDADIRDKVGLTVSIFCAGTPSLAGTRALIRHLGLADDSQVLAVKYRGEGWPGRMSVDYRDAETGQHRQASTSYSDGWGNVLQKHRQWRCQLCADHLGDHADLSIGDPWYRPIQSDDAGQSLVIVRTERGRRILQQAMETGVVQLERRSVATLAASQPNLEQTKGMVFGRCLTARLSGAAAPIYPGARLHRIWWRALNLRAKCSSIGGTIKRVVSRRLFHPERAVPLRDYR